MKLNRKWLLVIALVMSLTMATAGTLAYLTDSDAAANVMTLGNVKIEQHEYERVIENGEYETKTIDGTTSYVLKEFTQGKPLMPATELDANGNPYNFGAGDWDSTTVRMSQVGSYGGMQVFQNKNAQDKFVTVENTGRSDAYVRTLIALEIGGLTEERFDEVINTSSFMTAQGVWEVNDVGVVKIKGNNYYVYNYVYNGAKALGGVHENGVLPAGDTTYPSLAQVYMTAAATNEDCEKIDGNFNEKYDILVLSQAVQVDGFDDAKTALDAGFGKADAKNAENVAKWFGDSGVVEIAVVSSAQELKDAMLVRGAKIVLAEDIVVDANTPLQWGAYMFVANGREVTIDLNGKTITVAEDASLKTNGLFTTANKGTLNIVGEGTVEVKNGKSGIFHAMNANDQINVYGGTYISNSDNGSDALAIIYTNSGNVNVYGGRFIPRDGVQCANAEDRQGDRLSVVFHEGTLLKHDIYYAGYDATRIQLEEGCTLKEVTIDGETWYQVAKS